jgi:arginyl-tRNA synthetase
VNLLIESVQAHLNGTPVPADGYGGAYVKEIAEESRGKVLELIIEKQKNTLKALNVEFDNWFEENVLHDKGLIEKVVQKLKEKDRAYEKDGALWFPSTRYGDDKDRVLIRENGDTTYFAADIAYHADKFERGFDLLVNIWGTDHHGYVKRLRSALEALDLPSDHLVVILGQLVTLYRGDEPVRMSKRTGEMITLQEVIDETGADATRFFLLMTGADSHMDFDIELAKKKSMDNPVYYVQYAHARICSVFEEAKIHPKSADFGLLVHEAERVLIKKLVDFPDSIIRSAVSMEPHHLVRYARELAALFHSYYHKCRVITEDKELTNARLLLLKSTRIVLANVLKLLGIKAPERM